jgi:hypothetical protein
VILGILVLAGAVVCTIGAEVDLGGMLPPPGGWEGGGLFAGVVFWGGADGRVVLLGGLGFDEVEDGN